jgi:hypothetical protein
MVEFSEFKGKKVIILKRNAEDKYPVSFGAGKAKMIVDNIDAIKKFVQDNPLPVRP